MLVPDWRLASTINYAGTTEKALATALAPQFRSRIIRTEAIVSGAPSSWRRAGYLKILSHIGTGGYELQNEVVPLNIQKIYSVSRITEFYQLEFRPVAWLPRGLRVRFWEYTGPEPDAGTLNELLFLK